MIVRGTLARYLRRDQPFIETGTREGNTLAWAVELGAHPAYSVEVVPERFRKAKARFAKLPGVEVVEGDSVGFLKKVLKKISVSAVFWLDAHTKTECPILEELDVIASHQVKTHTIMIDDLRCFSDRRWKVSLTEVVAAVLRVNPNYRLTTEDGYVPGDILVAKVYGG